jgi:hypothetical protein
VGHHYGNRFGEERKQRGEWGVKGGGVWHRFRERRGRWDGARTLEAVRGEGGGGRRKLSGAHTAVRGEGGGGLVQPEATA